MQKRLRATLLNDTALTENHLGCDCVQESLRRGLNASNIEIKHRVPLRADWRDQEHIPHLKSADLVIINGEGSTHSSRDWVKELLRVAEFCKNNEIPRFLINCVYQDNDFEIDQLVSEFDLLTVRESASFSILNRKGIPSRIVPDLSFLSLKSFPIPAVLPQNNLHDGFSLYSDSVVPAISSELHKCFSKRDNFIPITIWKPDLPFFRRSRYRLASCLLPNRKRLHISAFTPKEAQLILRKAELIVTGRFHFVCFAIASGCPFFALRSNTHKIEGLLKDAGLSHRLIEIEQLENFPSGLPPWNEHDQMKCLIYRERAKIAISDMFKEIALACR